jgi:hypothetical protein
MINIKDYLNPKSIGVFLAGYCVSECIEKDYAVKPVVCTLACGVATLYGAKVTYASASLTYDKFVKPTLQVFLKNRRFGNGQIPGLPPK